MESISKELLVKLIFTKDEINTKLKWEHSKEFMYNGKMYDIVESIEKDNIIIYYCWLDKEETILNNKLDNLLYYALGNDMQNETNQKKLKKFAQSVFPPEENIKINFYQNQFPLKLKWKAANYDSIILNISSPPPKT